MGPAQSISGPIFHIPDSLGTRQGGNLFHSFSSFSVGAGEVAWFDGASDIARVFARVTGGAPSQIDGRISSSIPSADLYLINPSGIAFGAGARIDIGGAFYASTEPAIAFADGARFAASLDGASTFTAAEPVAFGFLDRATAALSVAAGGVLRSGSGKDLSLGARSIVVAGRLAVDQANLALATPTTGDIAIIGGAVVEATGAGSIDIATANLRATDTAQVRAIAGNGGGAATIAVRAGDIVMDDDSTIRTIASGTDNAGAIVVATNALSLFDGADITSRTLGPADSGPVDIAAATSLVADGRDSGLSPGIGSFALPGSTGNAGSLTVSSPTISLNNNALLDASSFGSGDGGRVSVTGGTLAVRGGVGGQTLIAAQAMGGGRGGDIAVEVRDLMLFGNLAGIDASAPALGGGAAGTITITTTTGLIADGAKVSATTFLGSEAGDVEIVARSLTISGGAIDVSHDGTGPAGRVSLDLGQLSIDGAGGGIFSNGAGGDISVDATDVDITNGATIASNVVNTGPQPTILVQATGTIRLDGGRIESLTSGIVQGGAVQVQADIVDVANDGRIASSTFGDGPAGSVRIVAGRLSIAGAADDVFTGVQTLSAGNGRAGSLDLSVGALSLLGNAEISSSSFAGGDAGDVSVTGGSIFMAGHGAATLASIGTNANDISSASQAGSVSVTVREISIAGNAEISSSTFTAGDAGTVDVMADTIAIDGLGAGGFAGFRTAAQPGSTGNAGALNVRAGTLSMRRFARISSQTLGRGRGGAVRVTAGDIDIAGSGVGRLTGISTDALNADSAAAGDITIIASELFSLSRGAQVTSTTFSGGPAGRIQLVGDRVTISGVGSGVFSAAPGPGRGNTVDIDAGSVDLGPGSVVSTATGISGVGGSIEIDSGVLRIDGGEITAASTGRDDAGDIRLTIGASFWSRFGRIATAASVADGGNIGIQVGLLLDLRDTTITTSVASGVGAGGNISIGRAARGAGDNPGFEVPRFVIVEDTQIRANAFGGPGGNVSLRADNLLLAGDSQITASSARSVDGVVLIDAPDTDATSGLTALSTRLADGSTRLAAGCATRRGRTRATFVGVGTGRVPAMPGGAVFADYVPPATDRHGQVRDPWQLARAQRPDIDCGPRGAN